MYSAAAAGIFDRRSSSRSASFLTASGMPAASIFSASSSISLVWSSPSPSSFWIAFICSRRKYSRWFLPTSDCTCDWIFDPSSSTSSSLIRIRFRLSMRAADVERLEHLLLHRRADRRQARRDEVGEPSRLGDVHRQRLQIVGEQRRQRDDLLEVGLDVPRERVDLEPIGVVGVLAGGADAGPQVRLRRDHLVEREPGQALDDQPQAAVGQLEHLVDVSGGADRVQSRPGPVPRPPRRAA